jgi:hypothetical protein
MYGLRQHQAASTTGVILRITMRRSTGARNA